MRIKEATKTPGMYFAMSNGNKIEKVFYSKEATAEYISKQNQKVRDLKLKIKETK